MKHIFFFFLFLSGSLSAQNLDFYDKIGNSIAHNFANNAKDSFDYYFDDEVFVSSVMSQLDLDKGMSASFKKGLLIGISGDQGFGSTIVANNESGGNYTYLRSFVKANNVRMLFRFISPDLAINYHEFIFPKGEGKYNDIYVFASGELFSKTLLDISRQMESANGKPLDKDKIEDITALRDLRFLIEDKKFVQAEKMFKALDKSVRQSKVGLLYAVQVNAGLNDTKHLKAIKAYRSKFPNDPSLTLQLIDYYFLKQNYEKLSQTIEDLDRLVKDPFLNVFRATVEVETSNDTDKVISLFEKANDAVNNMPFIDWTLGVLYFYYKEEADLFEHLSAVEQRTDFTVDDIVNIMTEQLGEVSVETLGKWAATY